MMRERDDYDDYMDALVMRMSHVVDGVEKLDVASAATVLLAYALKDMNNREEMLERLSGFVYEMWSLPNAPRH